MKGLTRVLAVGVCTVLLGAGLATTASAQSGEKALLTLTEPLDVGRTILQPGEYQFKIVPNRWNRNTLQVWSADRTKLFTTLLTVPHTESLPGEQVPESRYVYYPASADHIRALRTWYSSYTPASGGHDIVYPKQRALELAALVAEPVIAVADEVDEEEFETAALVVVTPEQEVKPYIAESPPEPEIEEEEPVRTAEYRDPLPQTASKVPLYAGLGFLSLLGALGLGVLARRLA